MSSEQPSNPKLFSGGNSYSYILSLYKANRSLLPPNVLPPFNQKQFRLNSKIETTSALLGNRSV